MKNIVKVVPPSSPLTRNWEDENTTNSYTATKHNPLETVYIVKIVPHGAYPTEIFGGYYETIEDAEKNSELQKYGGNIEQTIWGEIENIY